MCFPPPKHSAISSVVHVQLEDIPLIPSHLHLVRMLICSRLPIVMPANKTTGNVHSTVMEWELKILFIFVLMAIIPSLNYFLYHHLLTKLVPSLSSLPQISLFVSHWYINSSINKNNQLALNVLKCYKSALVIQSTIGFSRLWKSVFPRNTSLGSLFVDSGYKWDQTFFSLSIHDFTCGNSLQQKIIIPYIKLFTLLDLPLFTWKQWSSGNSTAALTYTPFSFICQQWAPT